jgi:hypothetical protein
MPITRRLVHCSLIAAAVVSLSAQGANAGSVPTSALAFTANAAEAMGPIQVVDRWDGPYRSYSYYDRPRVYGWYSGATERPVAPPARVAGPRVYGWYSAASPRVADCGEYHYWDGERCLDARYDPPNVGR